MSRFSDSPKDWQHEVPRYRTTRAVHPSPNNRFKFEPPFAQIMDSSEWQFAERAYAAGEEFLSRAWPHPSFRALNRSAEEVLQFFNSRMKSRLPRSPWRGGRIDLDDGLTGPTEPAFSINRAMPAA
jgi:hypothetical protein